MRSLFQARSFGRVRDEHARTFDHLRKAVEVEDGAAIGSEQLEVLVGLLNQHCSSDSGEFEGPHTRAVAIGAADNTQRDFGGGDRVTYECGRLQTFSEMSGFRVALPVTAVEADLQPGAGKRIDVRDAVGIGSTGENDIALQFAPTIFRNTRIEVKVRRIAEWQVRGPRAADHTQLSQVGPAGREDFVVISQSFEKPGSAVRGVERIVGEQIHAADAHGTDFFESGGGDWRNPGSQENLRP